MPQEKEKDISHETMSKNNQIKNQSHEPRFWNNEMVNFMAFKRTIKINN